MTSETTGHKGYLYCPVCEGHGGWDKQSSVPRSKTIHDNNDSYMECLWCGRGNTIKPTIDRTWKD